MIWCCLEIAWKWKADITVEKAMTEEGFESKREKKTKAFCSGKRTEVMGTFKF